MDFEDIYRKWENRSTNKPANERKRLADLVDAYPPTDDLAFRDEYGAANDAGSNGGENRRRVRNLDPQRSLDLHGFRAKEADAMIRTFIDKAVADGLEKVLIIHGKGKHSSDGTQNSARNGASILRNVVYAQLRAHPLAGETGIPDRRLGGSGAVWVVLRKKKRSR